MGRGGRGGGSRNPANQSREVQVSRKISWLLRHGADSEGLKLGKGGYVNVQDAVSCAIPRCPFYSPSADLEGATSTTKKLVLF
jgi:RNA:NAD 2'-phosphotransferase (TPT1/KptA family)